MSLSNRRSVMTLFSDQTDIYSHQVRIVLAEKKITVDIRHVDSDFNDEKVKELNPYGKLPILVDRELVLYHAPVILEYLDERFPHPPLLPAYPVARAESRQMMYRIENEWYSKMEQIETGNAEVSMLARQALRQSFLDLAQVFSSSAFFLSEEFSILDCCLGPLIWRFPSLGIEIPKSAWGLRDYSSRLFERPSFQESLTEIERELRAA